ncbi:MAG: hypothetical protein GF383_07295 [Candidatus Lokiarchaeota archaeon]|nr:hypothetical protein [Candidatus Lokiarchaeota archaeon]MBD3339973.1 hypothetical protein [Candidatus Lokiarchaeota archaeon]
MTNITIDLLKKIALSISENVSQLIGTSEGAKTLEKGAGGDVSMYIDVVAEDIVISSLEKAQVDVLLISEEIGEKFIGDKEKAIKNQKKLIVDPIDGSTNSSRGIPFCSVSLAYAEGNEMNDIKKAVILDLTTKDLYWAEKEKGAFMNDKKISVSENTMSDPLIFEIDYTYKHLIEAISKYAAIFSKLYKIRIMGSVALSFCLLAKGSIDGYIDFREGTRLVDIAGGYLIVQEAGGKMFRRDGRDLNNRLKMGDYLPIVSLNANIEPYFRNELKRIHQK